MSEITKDMIIADVLKMDKEIVPVFLKNGLHCLGCPVASQETIEQACAVHGINADKLIKELNDYFENN